MPQIEKWFSTWAQFSVQKDSELADLYANLIEHYTEPHRHYHTIRHLEECLDRLEELRGDCDHPAEIELALWFHDAVYDVTSSDNEEKSAEWAKTEALKRGVSQISADRVRGLILATKHTSTAETGDARILVDIDLSILGAEPERFDQYERQIRQEYSWVPGSLFRRKRHELLSALLARPSVYSTPEFRERYEARARANIARSLSTF